MSQPVKPSIPGSLDLPNGNLKAGDRIIITGWCRGRAYVRTMNAGGLTLTETVDSPVEDERSSSRPNTALFGDVIEILGIDYPWAVADVHSVRRESGDYSRARTCLDLREFECRPAAIEFVAAVMSGMRPEPAPAAADAAPKPKSPSALTKAVVGIAAACVLLSCGVLAGILLMAGAHA